jgi:hypothetical protein
MELALMKKVYADLYNQNSTFNYRKMQSLQNKIKKDYPLLFSFITILTSPTP